jgi:hypothetical protein
MKPCPASVGGLQVLCYTFIDERHRFTGNCKQIVADRLMGAMAGLAICQGEHGYCLFGCDADWQSVTDSWHQTFDGAKKQAEFEYEGDNDTWVYVN